MSKAIYKGITIEIDGNTKKLDKALNNVEKNSRSLQSELKGVNKLLKFDPSNTELLKQKQDLLTKSIDETKIKLQTLKKAQADIDLNKIEATDEQYRDLQREIISTEQKLKSLTTELKNFGSVGTQQIAVVGQKMQDVGSKIESAGKKLSIFSAGSTIALTAASKGAIDFETAFTGVTKTVDGTDEQLAKIKQGLLDLSKATSSSSTEIAAVAEAAGQLGVKTENILAFTEIMIRLGDSTNMSANEAATAIAQLYNIMGSDIDTIDQFGAAIVALGNNAATTEADIVNMASRIASSGIQVGLTEQEVLALSTTLASVGLEAENGGSAISAVITKIDKDVALNTDSLKTWANVADMSVKDFRNLWETDAMSAIQKVVKGMGDAKTGGENLNIILDELDISALRQTDTMKRLSSASELMSEMVNISNNAWEENSALTNESSKRYETTAAKITQMKNTVTELCVKLGDILLPILNKIISAISKFTNWLTNLNPAAQKIVLVVLAIVSAFGPFLIILAKLISSLGTIMAVVSKLIGIVKTVRTVFAAFNATLLANPIVLIVAAIAALIAGFVLLWKKCDWFRNFWIGLWENVKNVCKSVIDGIIGFFTGIIDFIKNNWQTLLLFIVNPFAGAFKLLYDKCEGFRNFIDGIVQRIKDIFASIVNFIKTYVIDPIINLFSNFIIPICSKIIEIIKKIVEIIFALYKGVAIWIYDNVIQPIWNAIVSFAETIKQIIQTIWNFIVSIFIGAFNWVNNNIIQPIWNAIVSFIENVKNGFFLVCQTIKNIFSPVVEWFSNIWNSVYTKLTEIFSKIGSFFGNLWTSIKDKFVSLGTNIASAISGAIRSGINGVISMIQNTINNAISLINGAIKLINKLPGVNVGKISRLRLPRLYTGAYVDKPMPAIVGDTIGEGEYVLPEHKLDNALMKALTNFANSRESNFTNQSNTTELLNLLNNYLPKILSNIGQDIKLDDGTLIGKTIGKIDNALGTRYERKERA